MPYEHIEVEAMLGALGAEISGVDLGKPLEDATTREIHEAFLAHQVVVFRDQTITPGDQLRFAEAMGEVDTYPFIPPLDGFPGVIPIIKEAATRINFGGGWHTDTSYMAEPPKATLLFAVEVPETGGDTLYANMYAAYDALSEGMKEMLSGMNAVYTAAGVHGAAGAYRAVRAGDSPRQSNEEVAEARHLHPVIRTHPETGRKAIYTGRFHVERLENMSLADSKPLLDYLTDHAVKPEFTMRLKWAPGTLAMWDNRCAQHYALNDYAGKRREMNRVTLKGDKPF